MTALKAKKLSCSEDEYDVFEEFVFHNSDKHSTAGKFTAKRTVKEKEKEAKGSQSSVMPKLPEVDLRPLRLKFKEWEKNIFEDYLCRKYAQKSDEQGGGYPF